MGLDDTVSPPKKKLKQAQLTFCNVSPKLSPKIQIKKRKLSEGDVAETKVATKVTRKNSDCEIIDLDKENVENQPVVTVEKPQTTEPSHNEISSDPKLSEKVEEPKSQAVSPSKDTQQNEESSEKEKTVSSSNDADGTEDKNEEEDKMNESIQSLSSEDSQKTEDDEDDDDGPEDELQTPDKKVSTSSEGEISMNISVDLVDSDEGKKSDVNVTPSSKVKRKRSRTPAQLAARQKKLEELEAKKKLKEERNLKRKQEKEEKLKALEEAKEKKRKLREEKERKKLEEKEEKERKKLEEQKAKEEEKKAKEEEKKKKEEAKLMESKKELQAKAAFVSFFIQKKTSGTPDKAEAEVEEVPATVNFMPFQVKNDMRLAPPVRGCLHQDKKEALETVINENPELPISSLYLAELKNEKRSPQKSEPTWPLAVWQERHDVIIIESIKDGESIDLTEDEANLKKAKRSGLRPKLFQFHENRRPPYWGTWRKKSSTITPRRPLGKDKVFDYEVDSDSEWEDEEEGENIEEEGRDSDKESDDEGEGVGENGYLLDNTFVPHGYLSDEEASPEDDNVSPEDQKLRMKVLKEEFEEEMKSKTERLKPKVLGCVWIRNDIAEVSKGSLYECLMAYRAVWDEANGPIELSGPVINESPTSSPRIKCFPSAVVEPLARFVHGSSLPLSQLVNDFLTHLEKELPTQSVSKRAVRIKIKDIACKANDVTGKQIWTVNDDLCQGYGMDAIQKWVPPAPTPPSVPEKPKLLDNFLKGNSPQPVRKRVPLITLPKDNETTADESSSKSEATPETASEPKVEVTSKGETATNISTTPKIALARLSSTPEAAKKRVPLISLPRTPETNGAKFVHQDTPRPSIKAFFTKGGGKATPPPPPPIPKPPTPPQTPAETIDLTDV